MGFTPTTHEPCLYYKYDDKGQLILVLRQVNNFLITGPTLDDCQKMRDQIAGKMTNKMNDLGVIKRFNGVDINQTQDYVKLSCQTYIDKIVSHHGWTNEKCHDFPVPMRNDFKSLSEIQLTTGPEHENDKKELKKQMGFNYRQAIGELIFAMSTCCINIDHGLYYWRSSPRLDLWKKPIPITYTSSTRLDKFTQTQDPCILDGSSDSTWANDKQHRRSVSGTAILLAGAVVYYRCQLQPTVALSSTEAEFAAMAETGKAALNIRSILNELGILQPLPTTILADNAGAIWCIAQAQQPTR